ncbi:MAG TPA: tetratricopeptide repeat protein, partial [Verrucomicrobium sp.]|nr:tetratricopeptide repeat protein [Verrucomicrobium sp.]
MGNNSGLQKMDWSNLIFAGRKRAILATLLQVAWSVSAAFSASTEAEQLTPTELYNHSMAAYNAGEWARAEELFDAFIKTYGGVPETAETARKLKPLLVSSKLQQKEYEDTLPLLEEVLKDPLLDPLAADELAFWRGICHLQLDGYDEARVAFGEFYVEKLPYVPRLPATHQKVHQGRRTEALLLNGMCLMLKGEFAESARFYLQQIPGLRSSNREAAGRATVLCLHSLIEGGDDNGALRLVKETHPRMEEISQVVVFHTLSLELGSRLLENGRYYDAIACLQRIWSRDRLLSTQRRAQALFTARLEQVKAVPGQEYLTFQYEGLLTRIKRERDVFEKIPNFDSALRLRIAMAYKELERFREAALVLEDMLQRLPPDDIVRQSSLSLIQCWLQVERWPRAVQAADAYLARFNSADNPNVPMAKFLKATALHSDHRAAEAEVAFAEVSQLHAQSEMAPRALFMEGICLMEQDLNDEAIEAFAQVIKDHPKSDLTEDAGYWTGMAHSFAKRHAQARTSMEAYLRKHSGTSRYGADAQFRIAFSSFGLADYPRAIPEL